MFCSIICYSCMSIAELLYNFEVVLRSSRSLKWLSNKIIQLGKTFTIQMQHLLHLTVSQYVHIYITQTLLHIIYSKRLNRETVWGIVVFKVHFNFFFFCMKSKKKVFHFALKYFSNRVLERKEFLKLTTQNFFSIFFSHLPWAPFIGYVCVIGYYRANSNVTYTSSWMPSNSESTHVCIHEMYTWIKKTFYKFKLNFFKKFFCLFLEIYSFAQFCEL